MAPKRKSLSRTSSKKSSTDDPPLDTATANKIKARQSLYKQEKELIPILSSPLPEFFTQNPTPLWKWGIHIDWEKFDKFHEESIDEKRDFSMYEGVTSLFESYEHVVIKKLWPKKKPSQQGRKKPVVSKKLAKYQDVCRFCIICPVCFHDPDTTLAKSIIGCSGKTSNISQHRTGCHQDLTFDDEKPDTQATLGEYATNQIVTRSGIRKEFRRLIYEFVNDCCLPASTVEKPEFRSLLQFATSHGLQLKDSKAENMSRREITKMRLNSYEEFLFVVSELGNNVRNAYHKLCKQNVPFGTLCHDIWNGPRGDILGVTIMFTDPRNCEVYRIPIGLAEIQGHSAADVAKLTHALLNQVGFSQSDLCASVNDNTASAVLAGKYILGIRRHGSGSGSKGKCDMHKAELILKHATGLVQRSRNKIIIDANPEFVEAYGIAKKFAAWLMSSRAPQRWESFKDFANKMGAVVIMIPLPNETRVSGCILLIIGLLRNKWIMDEYAASTINGDLGFKRRYPNPDVWEVLSQFEAILSPLKAVSLSLQVDAPGSSSASLLELYSARHVAKLMEIEDIECLPMKENLDNPIKKWDATKNMDDLDEQRDPIAFEDLHSTSRKLIRRIIKEYKTYVLEEKDEDAEKAMCCNPLLANIFEGLFKDLDAYDDDDISRVKTMFVEDMVAKFSNKRVSRLGTVFAKQTGNSGGTTDSTPTTSSSAKPKKKSKVASAFAKIREAREKKQQDLLGLSGKASNAGAEAKLVADLREACKECWTDFKKMCDLMIDHRWEVVIKKYSTDEFKAESQKWGRLEWDEFNEHCRDNYYLGIARYFDVMKWWKVHGSEYPFMLPSALIWLTKPPTNAFQERVFSASTWYHQNKLMGNMYEKHNEMRTLEKLTRPLRKLILQREAEIEKEETEKKEVIDMTAIDESGTKGDGTSSQVQATASVAVAVASQPVASKSTTETPSRQRTSSGTGSGTSSEPINITAETTPAQDISTGATDKLSSTEPDGKLPFQEKNKTTPVDLDQHGRQMQGRQLRMAMAIQKAAMELQEFGKKKQDSVSVAESTTTTRPVPVDPEIAGNSTTAEETTTLMKFYADTDNDDDLAPPEEADDIVVVQIPIDEEDKDQDEGDDGDDDDCGLLKALKEQMEEVKVESTGIAISPTAVGLLKDDANLPIEGTSKDAPVITTPLAVAADFSTPEASEKQNASTSKKQYGKRKDTSSKKTHSPSSKRTRSNTTLKSPP